MTTRITIAALDAVVARINRVTNSPLTPYTRIDDRARANVGNYHLSGAYGGWALHRMCNESGGIEDIFRCGHVTKRGLYDRMQAYLSGIGVVGGE